MDALTDKAPLNSIVSLFEVNFKSKPSPLPFFLIHGMEDLRRNSQISVGATTLGEVIMVLGRSKRE